MTTDNVRLRRRGVRSSAALDEALMYPKTSSAVSPDSAVLSVEAEERTMQPSMLYSVLPAIVQHRIPTLPSIRRTITEVRGRSIHVREKDVGCEQVTPETPPPLYCSRTGSVTPNRNSLVSTDTEDIMFRDDASERPSSSRSSLPPFPMPEAESGINWKYGNQGISLLTLAYQESNALASDGDDASAVLTRQMYLHSITYLLRGLPTDMSPEEILSVQAAIPAEILDLQNDPNKHALVPMSREQTVSQEGPPQDPSILHRVTAAVVFQTFIMIQFLLPYMKLFIGHAYRWERKHNITQRVFNKSIMTVDELGRRGLQLSQTVCQMNDGKVGQAINDLTLWWVRGLTGGIQQGFSEGVVMIGADRSQSSNHAAQKHERR